MASSPIATVQAYLGLAAAADEPAYEEEETGRGTFVTVVPAISDEDRQASIDPARAAGFRARRFFVERSTGDLFTVPSGFVTDERFFDAIGDPAVRSGLRCDPVS